jgi:glycosyltransferase involved in cell wall biosynthesis
MKIATMVRGYIPAPRPHDMVYAPIDLAVAISEGLTRHGHTVDYFGPNGTQVACTKVETQNLRPLARTQEEFQGIINNPDLLMHGVTGAWDFFLAREMFERAKNGEYDLLHFHHPDAALPFVHLYPEVPVVYTIHDPISSVIREVFEMYMTPNQFFVSISQNQRHPAPDLPYATTVYNGIDTDMFAFSEEHDDYLLAAGRIVPEKGFREAIQVAQQTNHRLLIIGPVYADHQEYFDQHIKPHLNEKILHLGFVEREHLVRYYQKAKAFLMPIQWEEPFGLTMIEALSCGTPVIAMNRGSAPEIMVNKKTGYIVNSISEMIEAVKKIKTIKAENCRKHVETHFSLERMVKNYETAFEDILQSFKHPDKAKK